MKDTEKVQFHRFRCRRCGTSFHIKRYANNHWIRYMPPRFCPGCGQPAGKEEDE